MIEKDKCPTVANPKGVHDCIYALNHNIGGYINQMAVRATILRYWIYRLQFIAWPWLLSCDLLNIKEIKQGHTILNRQHIGIKPTAPLWPLIMWPENQ